MHLFLKTVGGKLAAAVIAIGLTTTHEPDVMWPARFIYPLEPFLWNVF